MHNSEQITNVISNLKKVFEEFEDRIMQKYIYA